MSVDFTDEVCKSMAEVAKLLRVSVSTVKRLVRAGGLRGVKVGRQWRFTMHEIRRYLSLEAKGVHS